MHNAPKILDIINLLHKLPYVFEFWPSLQTFTGQLAEHINWEKDKFIAAS